MGGRYGPVGGRGLALDSSVVHDVLVVFACSCRHSDAEERKVRSTGRSSSPPLPLFSTPYDRGCTMGSVWLLS